jgi:hypothetical protein
MAFRKNIQPVAQPSFARHTCDMAGIGMPFNAQPNYEANIEDTIYFASMDGMEHDQMRTLAVMTHWFHFYSRLVNVDRLTRLVMCSESERVKAYWTGVAIWKRVDPRFRNLVRLYQGPRIDLTGGMDFYVMRDGEDGRFKDGPLRVGSRNLRQRDIDVIPIEFMKDHNRFIYYRLMIGPVYRADMWAMLDLHPELTTSELARRTYGSFSTAWSAHRDWKVVHHEE